MKQKLTKAEKDRRSQAKGHKLINHCKNLAQHVIMTRISKKK